MVNGSTDNIRKIRAYELRKLKNSYNAINKQLGIPKSTLSSWFKADKESIFIKNLLAKSAQKKAIEKLHRLALINKKRWEKIHLEQREKARQEFPALVTNQLFGLGLMLYWSEGDKKVQNGIVRISNIDFRLLRFFVAFLKKLCRVPTEKIKIWLLLYPDLNEEACKAYWSKKLNISLNQFTKAQFILGKSKMKKVRYGVCSVQVYSRELKEKIIKWIDLYSENFERAGII